MTAGLLARQLELIAQTGFDAPLTATWAKPLLTGEEFLAWQG